MVGLSLSASAVACWIFGAPAFKMVDRPFCHLDGLCMGHTSIRRRASMPVRGHQWNCICSRCCPQSPSFCRPGECPALSMWFGVSGWAPTKTTASACSSSSGPPSATCPSSTVATCPRISSYLHGTDAPSSVCAGGYPSCSSSWTRSSTCCTCRT